MIYDAKGNIVRSEQQKAAYQSKRLLASIRQSDFEEGWRELGSHPMLALNTDEILLRAYYAYMLSPLGGAMIEKPTDIIIGSGFDYKAGKDKVKEALDKFWTDPINNFPWRQDRMTAELAVFGEQCYSVHTAMSGRVRIGNIHPYAIERTIVDPENSEVVIGVKLKGTQIQILKTIVSAEHSEEDLFSKEARQMRAGFTTKRGPAECFFFAINQRTIVQGEGYGDYGPSLRGTTDLLPTLDWIFASDDFLSSMLERADVASRILWDVTYEGAGEEDIKTFNSDTDVPDKYTINTHNERIKWDLITPDLKASEHETSFRTIRNFTISGKGAGFPGHWFGDGGDVNRATAAEMYFPTIKRLNRRQWKLLEMFRRMMTLALVRRNLSPEFEMIAPTISEQDVERISNSLARIAGVITTGEDREYLTKEEARQIYRASVQELGTELGEYEEPSEEERRVTEDYRRLGKPIPGPSREGNEEESQEGMNKGEHNANEKENE